MTSFSRLCGRTHSGVCVLNVFARYILTELISILKPVEATKNKMQSVKSEFVSELLNFRNTDMIEMLRPYHWITHMGGKIAMVQTFSGSVL